MTELRKTRQNMIRSLVRGNPIRTQSALVSQLNELGFSVTQATISRDMAELRLEKDSNGVYVLPEDHRLQTTVSRAVRETRRAGNQVLLLSDPGTASSVAAALDAAQASGVLGSIAGDDTILVICADEEQGRLFQDYIDKLLEKH